MTNNNAKNVNRGFISALKKNFGFIETLNHDDDVFFPFSNFEGDPKFLELGQTVEYTIPTDSSSFTSGSCLVAENVKILPEHSIPVPNVLDTVYIGIVARPLRYMSNEKNINTNIRQEYSGLVEIWNDKKICVSTHQFGITSLVNKREYLQRGDLVTFKLDVTERAADIKAVRERKRAIVSCFNGRFGFLFYETEDGKDLYFHVSSVKGNIAALHSGDTVEFSFITNQVNFC